MKILLSKTFTKMFKIIPVIVVSIVSGAFGFLFSYIYNNISKNTSYELFSNNVINTYSLLAFMIIVGIMILVICANSSTGLFASEIHEGTMRLLLSKEISRVHLVLAKVLGMLLGSIAYLVMSFAIFLLVFSLFSGVERDILLLIIKATLLFIIYGVIIIFIIGGLGTFLSTVFQKKVPAILIMVALGGLIFGIIPIIRIILLQLGYYNRFNLYYVDINYHFGLIFNNFLGLLGDLSISQNSNGIFTMFTNLYTPKVIDIDIALNSGATYYALNTSLNALVVTTSYVIGAVTLYGISFKKMLKKDV